MEELIKKIIGQAQIIKDDPEKTDYDVAQFVHIELGKEIYYDNNYTVKLSHDKEETKLSCTRKSIILKANTDKSKNAQICKGMSEIYAYILSQLGIEARAIGIEKKGEIQEVSEDKAKHYCVLFKMGGQEYIQDYLIESALMRIKIGEAEVEAENMPGICKKEEYKERSLKSLKDTKLSDKYIQYIQDFFSSNTGNCSVEEIFKFIFERLNKHFENQETKFGFEESKDFVFLTLLEFIRTLPKKTEKPNLRVINIVNESELSCGVACFYVLSDEEHKIKKIYLVRGNESTDINFKAGEISESDLLEILNHGYEGRTQDERDCLAIIMKQIYTLQVNDLL